MIRAPLPRGLQDPGRRARGLFSSPGRKEICLAARVPPGFVSTQPQKPGFRSGLEGNLPFFPPNQQTQELSHGFSEKHALGSWKPGDDGSKSSDVKSFADGNSDVSIGNSSPEKTLGAQNFRVLFRTQWSWPTLGSHMCCISG